MDEFNAAEPPAEDDISAPPEPADDGLAFEDLTLGQALGYLVVRPVATGRRLWGVLARTELADRAGGHVLRDTEDAVQDDVRWTVRSQVAPGRGLSLTWRDVAQRRVWGPLIALVVAILLVLRGGSVLLNAALNPATHMTRDTNGAAVWFVLASAVVVGCALYESRDWWARRFPPIAAWLGRAPVDGDGGIADAAPAAALSPAALRGWLERAAFQLALIPLAVGLSLLAYTQNVLTNAQGRVVDVVLTGGGALAWALSIAVWIVVLGVDVRGLPGRARAALRSDPDWGERLVNAVRGIDAPLAALVGVTLFGLWFRLLDLELTPPEMTSDHIEKLLDALRVHEGYYAVFFPNNGGREAFQMYVVAFVADTLGVGFNFNALKWATAIEGVITLPVVFWMAQQVIGQASARERQVGRWVGVALAGLLAVSSWHLMLSRLGLRIVLTPLTTALVIGFLARAMRHNRARDYLALGAVLGAGFYFYQANRMLPLVVVAGMALAILNTARRWRDLPGLFAQMVLAGLVAVLPVAAYMLAGERAVDLLPVVAGAWLAAVALWLRADHTAEQRPEAWRYAGGLLMVVVIALALYVPMYHYSRLYPDQFWNRTQGRLFGENAFVRVNENGVTVAYEPALSEQLERFWDRRDVFIENYRDALRMYHWEGDAAWINNAGGRPALDGIAGGLLMLGAVLWVVGALRRRDAVWWLLPVTVIVMLLPSALTLAYTIENPSFTRTSGTIPAIFMLAALPLGLLLWRVSRVPGRVWGMSLGALAALVILAGVVGSALDWNRDNFFTHYHLSYSNSWKPYRAIARPLRSFAEGEGSYGNAFMVAYPHWLDHRILGAMAGDIRWPNGLVARTDLPLAIQRNTGTPYAYDPARPLFVMYHADDEATEAYLRELFPGGEVRRYTYTWQTGIDTVSTGEFFIYTVRAGALAE